jgi:ribosomal protein S18 acetylase RimI-like enzyme
MAVVYRPPESEKEFENYLKFRWEQLRKPLGLTQGSEQDELENSAFHIAAFNNEKIIGVGRLQIEKDASARIRYMAVDNQFRKQGIGSRLLEELENIAKAKGVKDCWLNARESAARFYIKNNYEIRGEATSESEIPHQKMEKTL